MIRDKIAEIKTKRKDEIKLRFSRLEPNAKKLIQLSHQLKEFKDSDGFNSLMSTNEDFRVLWNKNSEKILSLADDITKNIGSMSKNEDTGNEDYIWAGFMQAVESRISKDVVEICIMGPISTGKSTLLQGLTGAPDYILPSGKAKTTAARSTFVNSTQKSATITFYTVAEFRKILNKYVDELNAYSKYQSEDPLPKWTENENITAFCERVKGSKSYDTIQYSSSAVHPSSGINITDYLITFQLYIDNVKDYEDYLKCEKPEVINLYEKDLESGELMPYVSYKFPKKYGKTSRRGCFCRALAVKEAIIRWPLSAGDDNLGDISFVDTMGIGEAKFLVEEDLLNTIKHRADLGIALCKLSNSSDNLEANHPQDKKFIRLLSNLKDREPKNWLYYLCNLHSENDYSTLTCDSEVVKSFKSAVWNETLQGNNGFELNENYWYSLPFANITKKGDNEEVEVNKDGIKNFLVNHLLNHLDHDIEKMDDYFIHQAEDIVKKLYATLDLYKPVLLQINDALGKVGNRDTAVQKEVDDVFLNIRQTLDKELDIMREQNKTFCEIISSEIYPILSDPEIFNQISITNLDDDVRFRVKSGDGVNIAEAIKRSKLRQHILYQLNSFRYRNPAKPFQDAESYLKDEGIQYIVRRRFPTDEGKQSEFKDLYLNILESESKVLKKWYESTDIIIQKLNSKIGDQTSPSEINLERNCVGRELQCFYDYRELILQGIRSRINEIKIRISIGNNDPQETTLYNYFNGESSASKGKTFEAREQLCNAISEVIRNKIKDTFPSNELSTDNNGLDWLGQIASKRPGSALEQAFNDFRKLKVNLNEIVERTEANDILKSLLYVSLDYGTIEEIPYSFFNCLFDIDFRLRNRLCQMYINTFKHYQIFETLFKKFLEDVFGYNLKGQYREPYYDFRSILSDSLNQTYSCSNLGKRDSTIRIFNKIIEENK